MSTPPIQESPEITVEDVTKEMQTPKGPTEIINEQVETPKIKSKKAPSREKNSRRSSEMGENREPTDHAHETAKKSDPSSDRREVRTMKLHTYTNTVQLLAMAGPAFGEIRANIQALRTYIEVREVFWQQKYEYLDGKITMLLQLLDMPKGLRLIQESVDKISAGKAGRAARECSFCSDKTHNKYQCNVFPSAFARRQRLQDLGRCMRCLEDASHTVCPKETHECSICKDISGKTEVNHDDACCDIRFGLKLHDIDAQRTSPVKGKSTPMQSRQQGSRAASGFAGFGPQHRGTEMSATYRIPKKQRKLN